PDGLDQQHGGLKIFRPGIAQNIDRALEQVDALMLVVGIGHDRRDDVGALVQHPRNRLFQDMGVLARRAVLVAGVHVPDRGAVFVGFDRGLDVFFHGVGLAGILLPIHERAGRGDVDDQLLVHGLVRQLHVDIAENAGIEVVNVHHGFSYWGTAYYWGT